MFDISCLDAVNGVSGWNGDLIVFYLGGVEGTESERERERMMIKYLCGA